MKNIVVFSGSSHPQFVDLICEHLGIQRGHVRLNKFSNFETNVEFQDSVRDKDVFIVQSGCGNVNDSIIELLIMVGACKTASAKSVNAVLPSFPYARQPDVPYAKSQTHILRYWTPQESGLTEKDDSEIIFPIENTIKNTSAEDLVLSPDGLSFPIYPAAKDTPKSSLSKIIQKDFNPFVPSDKGPSTLFKEASESEPSACTQPISIPQRPGSYSSSFEKQFYLNSLDKTDSLLRQTGSLGSFQGSIPIRSARRVSTSFTLNEVDMPVGSPTSPMILPALSQTSMAQILQTKMVPVASVPKKEKPKDLYYTTPLPKSSGYKRWSARTGTLVANLLTESGADRIITMDLHDPQFQGYFDVPVDLLYAEPSILHYIKNHIPNYQEAVVVSPDAGGAKRATSIANKLNLEFALIHKEGKVKDPKKISLVGNVEDKIAIIIDDIADTCGTLGLAAEILLAEGASEIHAIVTHGMLSGPALEVINKSCLSSVAVSNTIPQDLKLKQCSKLVAIDVSHTFAEAIRRIYYGESLTQMFKARWF